MNGAQGREEERGTPSRSCTTNIFPTDSSVLFPFQRLPHMLDMGLKTNAFLYMILPSFFLFTFQWLIFINGILRNFDCIKVCRSGLWSNWHYAGSPPTNSPPPFYQTTLTFTIQEQTTLSGELTGGERITTRHSLVHTKDNFETIKKCTKLKFACLKNHRCVLLPKLGVSETILCELLRSKFLSWSSTFFCVSEHFSSRFPSSEIT